MLSRSFVRLTLVGSAITAAGCAKSDSKSAADSAASATPVATPATAAPAPAAALLPADVAGTWTLLTVPQSGADTTPTEATWKTTGDTAAWKVSYKNGPTLPLHVSFSGDSMITDVEPHMSVRAKGVQVSTHGVYRKQGDKLVGLVTAHYHRSADSVLVMRGEATRVP